MVTEEMKNNTTTVRFHDEFCVSAPQQRMERVNDIVTQSYKRRKAAELAGSVNDLPKST